VGFKKDKADLGIRLPQRNEKISICGRKHFVAQTIVFPPRKGAKSVVDAVQQRQNIRSKRDGILLPTMEELRHAVSAHAAVEKGKPAFGKIAPQPRRDKKGIAVAHLERRIDLLWLAIRIGDGISLK